MNDRLEKMNNIILHSQGEKFYEFAKMVLNRSVDYIVAVDLQTLKLLNFMKERFIEEGQEVSQTPLITVDSFYTKVDALLAKKKTGHGARIALVECCMEDGQEINYSLDKILNITRTKIDLSENGKKEYFPISIRDLVDDIDIHNFCTGNIRTIMASQYAHFLKEHETLNSSSLYGVRSKLISLAGHGLINLIPNSLSISMNDFTPSEQEMILSRLNQMKRVENSCHKDVSWSQNIEAGNQIFAIASYFGIQDEITKSLTIAPYIIYSSVNEKQVVATFKEIDNQLGDAVEKEWKDQSKRSLIVDSLFYFFHQNMLLEILEGIENKEKYIDYSYIDANYNTLSYVNEYKLRTKAYDKDKWHVLLTKLIYGSLQASLPNLSQNILIDTESVTTEWVEDTLFDWGLTRKQVYWEVLSGKRFTDRLGPINFEDFIYKGKETENYFKNVHLLLENLNLGMLSFTPMREQNGEVLIQQCYPAEEAIFIKPMHLRKYFSLIAQMGIDCLEDEPWIKRELKRVMDYLKEPEMLPQLIQLIDDLNSKGEALYSFEELSYTFYHDDKTLLRTLALASKLRNGYFEFKEKEKTGTLRLKKEWVTVL